MEPPCRLVRLAFWQGPSVGARRSDSQEQRLQRQAGAEAERDEPLPGPRLARADQRVEDEQHGRRRAVAAVGEHLPGGCELGVGEVEAALDAVQDLGAARVHRPVGDVVGDQPVRSSLPGRVVVRAATISKPAGPGAPPGSATDPEARAPEVGPPAPGAPGAITAAAAPSPNSACESARWPEAATSAEAVRTAGRAA